MAEGGMEGSRLADASRVVAGRIVRMLCGLLKQLALGLSLQLDGGIMRLNASLASAAVTRSAP